MREVLFGGKSIKNGQWVYGNGVDLNWSDVYILVKEYDGTVGYCGVDEVEVEPSTVGQYTGLTDKNGTKIFEGDIANGMNCLHPDRNKFRVSFTDGGFYLVDEDDVPWHIDNINGVVVIGNIYDNPELVETR